MSTQVTMEQMFTRLVDAYSNGTVDVSLDRTVDPARRSMMFYITFQNGASGPRPYIEDLLDALKMMIDRRKAYIQSFRDHGGRIEFSIPVGDIDYLEYALQRGRMPSFAIDPAGSVPHTIQPANLPKFSFTPSPKDPPKPKKIQLVKKIQTTVEIGYRDFTYLKKGNQSRPMLLSRNGVPWPRYEPLVASCNGDPFKEHDAPSVGCECGIYAYNKPDNPNLKQDAFMWGEIALWGRTFICPDGFRAQFAYPQNIFMKDVGTKTVRAFAAAIEKEYGVPVHLVKERRGKTASAIMAEMIDKLLLPEKNPNDAD